MGLRKWQIIIIIITATTHRAAVRILSSSDKPVSASAESLQTLKGKHHNDEVTLNKVIQSNGSSGGPDGLRPQQLNDLAKNKESGQGLLILLSS